MENEKIKKNEIINTYGYISEWDTSQVKDMSYAFAYFTSFTGEDNTEYQKSQNINTKLVKYIDSNGNEQIYTAWDSIDSRKYDLYVYIVKF